MYGRATLHDCGDVFAQRRPHLESVSRAASDEPHVLVLRVAIYE